MENRGAEEEIHLNYSIVKEEYCVEENGVDQSDSETDDDADDEELVEEERSDEDDAQAQELIQFEITEIEQALKPKHEQLMCLICEETFTKLPALKAHMLTHTENQTENSFQCPHCPQTFRQNFYLNIHIRTHDDDPEFNEPVTPEHHLNKPKATNRPHKCKICFKGFLKPSHLKRHLLIHMKGLKEKKVDHKKESPVLKTRSALPVMKQSKKLVHKEESPVPKAQSAPSAKKQGNKSVHRLQCPICFMKFKKLCYLKNHASIHTSALPYKCDVCGKAFRRKDYLKTHSSAHDDSISKTCPFCNKTMTTLELLKKHIRWTHDENQEQEEEPVKQPMQKHVVKKKPHKKAQTKSALTCKICKKIFKNTKCLRVHMKRLHAEQAESNKIIKTEMTNLNEEQVIREIPTKSPVSQKKKTGKVERPFECQLCDGKFKRKDHLNSHMETHSYNRKTFSCTICGQSFFWLKSLTCHEATHLVSKGSVSCPRCNIPFSARQYLNKHLKNCKSMSTKNTKASIKIKEEMV